MAPTSFDQYTAGSTRKRRTTLLASPLLCVGLLLSACGGGETSTTDDASAAAQPESADAADGGAGDGGASDGEDAPASSDPNVSPLRQALGFGGDPAEQMAEQAEKQRKAEDIVAACMREQGFEYTPFVPDLSDSGFDFDADFESREWVEANGFGISTTGFGDLGMADGSGENDPNRTYAESLTDAERDAYYAALYGPEPEPTDGEDMQIFEPAGCTGDAFADQFADFAIFEELDDQFELMEERAAADPRMIEIDKAWAECMREAGYDFATQQDATESVMKQMNSVGGGMVMFGLGDDDEEPAAMPDPTAGMTEEELQALTPEEMQELFQPKIDEAALAELQTYERTVAVAAFDCDGDNADLRREIQFEYEQKMIDENQDVFDKAGS